MQGGEILCEKSCRFQVQNCTNMKRLDWTIATRKRLLFVQLDTEPSKEDLAQ